MNTYEDYDDDDEELSQDEYQYQSHYDNEPYYHAQNEPEPKKKKKRFFFWLVFIIALCVLLYSSYQLFIIFKANWDEKRELDKVTEIAKIPENIEEPFEVDWDGLRAINADVVAWLIVPNTDISYPVVQGKDNSYYLDRTFAKEYNYAGAIFVDYQMKGDFSENNTFIYGHNVRHGSMFAQLEKFTEEAFFNEQKYVYLFTPTITYRAEIISFYSTKDGSKSYRYGITDPKEWKEYINLITDANAFVHEEVSVKESDRLITLSTCSYEIGDAPSDARYLLHAKLVPWIGHYIEETPTE